jgi:NADPH:quinone reductase-like Zn-dependent oxidoreductase
MATARGATVIATAVGDVDAEHVRRLGAAHVVDHTRDLVEQVRTIAPTGVDAVLHFAGDPYVLADLLAEGGRFASLLMMTPDQFGDGIPMATAVYAEPVAELLESLAREVVEGRLVVPIQRSYALGDVPRAFADFAAGTLGKLAITVA